MVLNGAKDFKAFQVWNDSYDTRDNAFLTKVAKMMA
jgi:hypothetical protein